MASKRRKLTREQVAAIEAKKVGGEYVGERARKRGVGFRLKINNPYAGTVYSGAVYKSVKAAEKAVEEQKENDFFSRTKLGIVMDNKYAVVPAYEGIETSTSPRLSQSDVAKLVSKADPKVDFDPEQLRMGVEVELEHTSDPLIAEKIARDHLRENPKYYSFLKQCAKEHGVSLREDGPFAGFESWRKKPFPKTEETQMEGRATWELGNMKKALESLPILNSDEDNERLWRVREELRRRRSKK
jgi:hypothetical protein